MSNPKVPANISKPQVIVGTIMTLEDNMKLSEIILGVANAGVTLDDVYLDRDWGYQDEPETWTIKWARMETPEEVQHRVDEWIRVYNERMVEIDAKAERKRAQRNDKDWKEFQRLKKKFGNLT